jgi:hypothetical protein
MAPTVQDLVSRCENDLSDAQRREDNARAEIRAMLDMATDEGRRNLTQAETERSDKLFKDIDAYEDDRKYAERKLAAARREMAADQEYLTRASTRVPAASSTGRTAMFSVGRNERTYHLGVDREAGGSPGSAFLLDAGKAFLGDPLASDRLARHQREEFAERPGWNSARFPR